MLSVTVASQSSDFDAPLGPDELDGPLLADGALAADAALAAFAILIVVIAGTV